MNVEKRVIAGKRFDYVLGRGIYIGRFRGRDFQMHKDHGPTESVIKYLNSRNIGCQLHHMPRTTPIGRDCERLDWVDVFVSVNSADIWRGPDGRANKRRADWLAYLSRQSGKGDPRKTGAAWAMSGLKRPW